MGQPLAPILKLELIPDTKNEAIVSVNGQKYKFTILKDTTNITETRDWKQLAELVTHFFLQDTGKSSIENGELVLSGDFDGIETATTLSEKTVSFVSSTVQYIEGTETKAKVLKPDSISGDSKKRVDEHLKNIGKTFAWIRPISSPLVNPIGLLPTNSSLSFDDLIEVDASGQCADSSLAYQILTKAGQTDLLTTHKPNVYEGAKFLREKAAEIIEKTDDLDKEPVFINCLESSIRHIPDLLPDNINTILGPNRNITKDERKTLRTFYASYITQENSAGKMDNFLDAAFFYVLPQIRVPSTPDLTPYFPNRFRCAIVQNGAIFAQYPSNAELNSDWLFIWYNGLNHYKAVNMERAQTKAKIEEMIKASQNKLLKEDLFDFANMSMSSAEEIKRRLQEEIRLQNPSAYNKIAQAIYEYDLQAWENSDRSLDKPGSIELTHAGRTYKDYEYGDYRIDAASPEELKTILLILCQDNKI